MSVNLEHPDRFVHRHIGPGQADVDKMLGVLGVKSLEELCAQTVPESIRLGRALDLPPAVSEAELLAELEALSQKNQLFRSFLGMGYSDCVTPPVILRNVVQNPGW